MGEDSGEKSIAVVIPTYKEKENIADLIDQILLEFDGHSCKSTLFIIDDNSPDKTYKIAWEKSKKDQRVKAYCREGRRDRGLACIFGFQKAIEYGADIIVEMDADFSHDPKDIFRFVKELSASENANVLLGSRFLEAADIRNRSMIRNFITFGAIKGLQYMFKLPFSDPNSSFRCYKAKPLKKLLPTLLTSDYRELLIKAYYFGYHIEETPIIFRDREKGPSKVRFIAFIHALRVMVSLRRNLEYLATI